MKKRLEAWAVSWCGSPCARLHATRDAAEQEKKKLDRHREYGNYAVVRLVECGPDEVPMPKAAAAVVRAAVRWAANASELAGAELYSAVRSMQKGRRK